MVPESCNGEIRVPLAGRPGWGLVCSDMRVAGGSMAGGGFALHGFSLYLNVAYCLLVKSGVVLRCVLLLVDFEIIVKIYCESHS